MGGMFLELDKNQPHIGESASVTFTLSQKDGDISHSLNVVIARKTDDGLGIAFAQSNASTFRSIQELLKFSKYQTVH